MVTGKAGEKESQEQWPASEGCKGNTGNNLRSVMWLAPESSLSNYSNIPLQNNPETKGFKVSSQIKQHKHVPPKPHPHNPFTILRMFKPVLTCLLSLRWESHLGFKDSDRWHCRVCVYVCMYTNEWLCVISGESPQLHGSQVEAIPETRFPSVPIPPPPTPHRFPRSLFPLPRATHASLFGSSLLSSLSRAVNRKVGFPILSI